jgi:hypothetical protein
MRDGQTGQIEIALEIAVAIERERQTETRHSALWGYTGGRDTGDF